MNSLQKELEQRIMESILNKGLDVSLKKIRFKKKWGFEYWPVNSKEYCTKYLLMDIQGQCSYHFHLNKDELFTIFKGKVVMIVYDKNKKGFNEWVMLPGNQQRIIQKRIHSFIALEDSIIIESSTHHEDEDSYRIRGKDSRRIPDEEFNKLSEKYY